MAGSDFPRPYIIGYGSSPSRCVPELFVVPWSDVGSPGSRATSFHTCQVLRPRRAVWALAFTRPSVLPSAFATASAPGIRIFTRLNGWPECSPTDASPPPLRATAHGSGPMWLATPSSYRICTDYSLPVSRRTAKESVRHRASSLGPARPRAIGCDGANGRMIVSQARQENFSRTCWFTFHWRGISSSGRSARVCLQQRGNSKYHDQPAAIGRQVCSGVRQSMPQASSRAAPT
jgi:hypothetical protein